MSSLAFFCLEKGINVYGSDRAESNITKSLVDKGAKVFYSHLAKNLPHCDAVVFTSAIDEKNEELIEAKKRGIRIYPRAEFLSSILSLFRKSIGIAGCHGKTTATAMIANVLIQAGLDPTVFLGGEDKNFSNFRLGGGDIVLTEACEYKKNLSYLSPSIALVLNVDNDHLDSYADMEDLTDTFRKFVKGKISVINADDKNSLPLFNDSTVTFGINEKATYTAKNIKFNGKGYSFTACIYSKSVCRINLKVSGVHNVYNALSCLAVCHILGCEPQTIKKGLESFCGVKRRDEYLGEYKGLKVYADYAHHPKEIFATLNAYKTRADKFAVIFQPHTFSRTKILMQDFVDVFRSVDNLILFSTYPAREEYDYLGSEQKLYENLISFGCSSKIALSKEELLREIDGIKDKVDSLLVLGAGDIYQIFDKITKK